MNTLKYALSVILFLALVPAFTMEVVAQGTPSAAQNVENLRAQLVEVQAKEAELQARARQLDEQLKPENIERSLAGVGSTKPEELRELRRRQLTIERESVGAQLNVLATSRQRLESALSIAEAQAYQQSADGTTASLKQMLSAQYAANSRWLAAVLMSLVAILGIVLVIAMIRRPRI